MCDVIIDNALTTWQLKVFTRVHVNGNVSVMDKQFTNLKSEATPQCIWHYSPRALVITWKYLVRS